MKEIFASLIESISSIDRIIFIFMFLTVQATVLSMNQSYTKQLMKQDLSLKTSYKRRSNEVVRPVEALAIDAYNDPAVAKTRIISLKLAYILKPAFSHHV